MRHPNNPDLEALPDWETGGVAPMTQHSEHTAGPWHWDGEYLLSVREDGVEYILSAEWRYNSEQSKANARLIAAAPELLAACEEVAKVALDNLALSQPGLHDYYLDVVRAAIAKARGEAQ